MTLALGFVIAALFLRTRVAERIETPVSLLQTRSLVQHSHTVPNDFFEDAVIVPTSIGQRTNYHAEAQRQSQTEGPVVARFDVGSNAVPLPAWAVEDAGRSMNTPIALTQSRGSRTASSPSSWENRIKAMLTANPQPEPTVTLSQEREQASLAEEQSVIAQVDPVPAQTAEEITDPSELEILASEPPLASQMSASEVQQSEDEDDIAARFVECQADEADCMKTKKQSRLSSPFSHHQRQQRVEEKRIYTPAARQSPRHDTPEITAQLAQVEVERQIIPPSMFTPQEQSLPDGGALQALQQQKIESVERMGQQETVPNSLRNLPAEEALVREAQRLEEQQQHLLHQVQLQQNPAEEAFVRKAQRSEEQQRQLPHQAQLQQFSQLQNSEQQKKRRHDDMTWLATASVAEVRDYFNALNDVTDRTLGVESSTTASVADGRDYFNMVNDVKDRTLGGEPLSEDKPVGSQLQIPGNVGTQLKIPVANTSAEATIVGTQLKIPAANTSAEATSLEREDPWANKFRTSGTVSYPTLSTSLEVQKRPQRANASDYNAMDGIASLQQKMNELSKLLQDNVKLLQDGADRTNRASDSA
jgi:hypothetical protein